MKKPLGRLAAAVLTGAALTLASAPAAFAQDDPGATPTTAESTTESTSSDTPTSTETSPSETPTSESSTTTPDSPASDTPTTDTPPGGTGPTTPDDPQVRTTEAHGAPQRDADSPEEDSGAGQGAAETTGSSEPGDDYTDNAGHGFVGLGGEGVLVIACAAGAPGNLATLGLNVTAGPDQDGADGRYWNYDVRVVDSYTGTTAPFSWTCDGQEGHGDVTFETAQPPTSDTPTTSETPTGSETPTTSDTPTSSDTPTGSPTSDNSPTASVPAPGSGTTTTPSATSTTRPSVQVRYSPQGGVETGFGGTALFWF